MQARLECPEREFQSHTLQTLRADADVTRHEYCHHAVFHVGISHRIGTTSLFRI